MKGLELDKLQIRHFPLPKLSNCQFFRRGNFARCGRLGNIRSLLSSPRSTKSNRRPSIFKANSFDPTRIHLHFPIKNGLTKGKRCFTEGVSPNRHPHDSKSFDMPEKILPTIKVDLSNLANPREEQRLYHLDYHKKLKLIPLEETNTKRENSIKFSGKIAQIFNLDLSFRCKPKLSPASNRTIEMFKFRKTPRFKRTNQRTKYIQNNSSINSHSMIEEVNTDFNITFGKEQFANITTKLPTN